MKEGRVTHKGFSKGNEAGIPDLQTFDGPPEEVAANMARAPQQEQEVDENFGPQEKVSARDPMPSNAAKERAKLDNLFMLGFLEEEIEIGGYIFKVHTLTNRENQKIATLFSKLGETEGGLFSVNDIVLAYAINTVNDTSLEELYDGNEKDSIMRKVSVIKDLQQPVVNRLMEFYKEMSEKSSSQIGDEEIKK